jgi:hypothetical protein
MKRNTAPLTDRGIRSLKAEGRTRVEAMDSLAAGLGVRVLPTGHKSWFLRYGPREARRRIVLGSYPSLSLEDARIKARELVSGLKGKGQDPMAERKAERTARRKAAAGTFETLAESYLEEHAKRRKRLRGWQEDERKLRIEVLPVWAPGRRRRSSGPMPAPCSKGSRRSGAASVPTGPGP